METGYSPYLTDGDFEPRGAARAGLALALPPIAAILLSVALVAIIINAARLEPSLLRAEPRPAAAAPVEALPVEQPPETSAAAPGQPVAPAPGGTIAAFFMPPVQYWSESIAAWAAAEGLDPNLVATVMQIESCGDPQALSVSGARSLFQVMPFHFSAGEDPFDPQTNARRGLAYLKKSLDMAGGDARLALAGYNGGTGVIARDPSTWADETQRYARWGEGIYNDTLRGATQSATLDEWLGSGGASLCAQASDRLGLQD
jgi:soluble lytic murein transglycosylase-like protein